MRKVVAFALLAALGGCTLFSPLGYLQSEGSADGGDPPDGTSSIDANGPDGSFPSLPAATDLATGQELPGRIVQDANAIYWVNGGTRTIRSMAKTGGAKTDIASDAAGKIQWLAVDDSYVYWTNDKTIERAPKAGGSPEQIYLAIGAIDGFAVDDTTVWVNETKDDDGTAILARSPKTGGGREVLTTDDDPDAVATDSTAFYWTDFTSSALKTLPKGASFDAGITKIGDENDPIDPSSQLLFAIDGEAAYFNEGDGVLWRHQRIAAAKRQQLFSSDTLTVSEIAIDDLYLYYLDGGSTLARIDKTKGGARQEVTKASSTIGGIATDNTAVYFTVQGVGANDGAIRRVSTH